MSSEDWNADCCATRKGSAMSKTEYCVSNVAFEMRMGFSVLCKFCLFSEGSFEITELTIRKQLFIDVWAFNKL